MGDDNRKKTEKSPKIDPLEGVRDLSWPGTESVGRKTQPFADDPEWNGDRWEESIVDNDFDEEDD